MVIPIGNIWIARERVVAHVRDMVPSFRIVLWIFKRGKGERKRSRTFEMDVI
jgi:hypothetical protein